MRQDPLADFETHRAPTEYGQDYWRRKLAAFGWLMALVATAVAILTNLLWLSVWWSS